AEAAAVDQWQRLVASAQRFEQGRGDLLQGLDLANARAWWDEERPNRAWADRQGGGYDSVRAYLDSSQERHDEIERARLAAEAREKRGLRRRAALWAGVALLTTASAGAAAVMWGNAETQKSKAEAAAVAELKQRKIADRATQVARDRHRAALEAATRARREGARAEAAARKARAAAAEADRHKRIAQTRLITERQALRRLIDERARTAAAELQMAQSEMERLKTEIALEAQTHQTEEANRKLRASEERTALLNQAVQSGNMDAVRTILATNTDTSMPASNPGGLPGPLAAVESPEGRSEGRGAPSSGSPAADQPVAAATLAEVRTSLAAGPDPSAVQRAASGHHALVRSYEAALRKVDSAGRRADRSDLDELVRLADELAWFGIEIEDRRQAASALASLHRIAERMPAAATGPRLAAQAAAVYLDAEESHRSGDSAKSKLLEQQADRLAGQIAADADSAPSALAIAFRIKRYMARVAGTDLPLRRTRVAEGCAIAERIARSFPGAARTVRIQGRCLIEQGALAEAEGRREEAGARYAQALELAQQALQGAPSDQWLVTAVMDGAVNLAWLPRPSGGEGPQPAGDPEPRDRWRRTAADALIDGYEGQALESVNGDLVRDVYEEAARTEFRDRAVEIDFFARVERALAPFAEAFPKSSFGYVTADARRRIGEAFARDPPDEEMARRYFELADSGYRRADLLGALARDYARVPLPGFSELPASVCGTSQRLATLLAEGGQLDRAVAVHDRMMADCQPALDAYPFDFYLRMALLRSYANLGAELAEAGRGAQARPYLEYASHWGNGDSTKQLADLYEQGSGVPRDTAKAERLRTLAEGQTMKRFTVPTLFGEETSPFYIYVRAWPSEYIETLKLPGIEDQVKWVKEARGGTVPTDVRESFIKLQQIALENNVSFPELTEYALAAASDPTVGATREEAAAIAAAIKRERFSRNASIDSDAVGVALKGYDPVAYHDGAARSGDAGSFLLWSGAIWLFSNETNRGRFKSSPERFAPAFGGYCATCLSTGNLTSADPLIFAVVNGRLLMFSNEDRRRQWLDAPAEHQTTAAARWDDLRRRAGVPANNTRLGRMISEILAPE
ncbi:MAG TPA: YHS domain-containing (seleno)protein, partial [Allosphingosinicella sp.]|nr:YHS domain-containing (seleno)protein [Allosphingosinicella sp.]